MGMFRCPAASGPAITPALGFTWGVRLGDPGWSQHRAILRPSGILEACSSWSSHGPGTETSAPLLPPWASLLYPWSPVTGGRCNSDPPGGRRRAEWGKEAGHGAARAGLSHGPLRWVLKEAKGGFPHFLCFFFLPFLRSAPSQPLTCLVFLAHLFPLASLSTRGLQTVLPTQRPGAGLLCLSAGRRGVRVGPRRLSGWPYGNGILVSQFQFLLCALLPVCPEARPVEPAGLG